MGLPRVYPEVARRVRCGQASPRQLIASGWFSDRTERYLAAGRPALVQDTGWSTDLPTGAGRLRFSNCEEALEGLDWIPAADWKLAFETGDGDRS